MLLAVATPTHMMEPVKAGTLNVVRVKNRKRIMPQSAAGSAVMMMNGSSHDWKLTTISMYTRTMENPRPANSPTYDVCMVSSWPANMEEAASRKKMLVGLHDPADVPANAVQIAALNRAINIDYAADVVMRKRFHLVAAANRRHI